MRPTIAEHLFGIGRLLDAVAEDPGLSEASRRLLSDATKQLARLAAGADERGRFVDWDNAATLAVLADLDGLDLDLDLLAADAVVRNGQLRQMLVTALETLGEHEEGARAQITRHLRHRVDANPALNKQPRYPTEDA